MDASTASWSWSDLPDQNGTAKATNTPKPEPQAEPSQEQQNYEQQDRSSSTSAPGEKDKPETRDSPTTGDKPKQEGANATPGQGKNRRHYGDRTCRICLDTVSPRFADPSTGILGGFMGEGSKPVYISVDDPELGRLISPCKCKGSQRYVHEGCLKAWRTQARGGVTNPNFFTCGTCGYHYRLERIAWARRLQNKMTQLCLTAFIFFFAVFLLGFFAESIFRIWNDPMGTITDTVSGVIVDLDALEPEPVDFDADYETLTWFEHFTKGFLSLGIIGFAKYFFTMSPFQWWNVRSSGILGPTVRRGGGRGRAENISWALVLVGAISFIYTVWKSVRGLSNMVLKKAGDGVLDVGGDDDDDDDDDDDNN